MDITVQSILFVRHKSSHFGRDYIPGQVSEVLQTMILTYLYHVPVRELHVPFFIRPAPSKLFEDRDKFDLWNQMLGKYLERERERLLM